VVSDCSAEGLPVVEEPAGGGVLVLSPAPDRISEKTLSLGDVLCSICGKPFFVC
jgi:hypothetical protein